MKILYVFLSIHHDNFNPILVVDFVVCTLAVEKKKIQGRFRHVRSDHSVVSIKCSGLENLFGRCEEVKSLVTMSGIDPRSLST
jgi:hypothetical protein